MNSRRAMGEDDSAEGHLRRRHGARRRRYICSPLAIGEALIAVATGQGGRVRVGSVRARGDREARRHIVSAYASRLFRALQREEIVTPPGRLAPVIVCPTASASRPAKPVTVITEPENEAVKLKLTSCVVVVVASCEIGRPLVLATERAPGRRAADCHYRRRRRKPAAPGK